MRVQSPVGEFPLRVRGVRLREGRVTVDTALGAWTSGVTFDRSDLAVAGFAVAVLAFVFVLGRASGRRLR